MIELTRPLRQTAVRALNASSDVTALCEGRVYRDETPKAKDLAYPFVLVSQVSETPTVLACYTASEVVLDVQCFDNLRDDDRLSRLTGAAMTALKHTDDLTPHAPPVSGDLQSWRRTGPNRRITDGEERRIVLTYQALVTQP